MSVLTRKTIVGIKEEVSEGTFLAPTASDLIQVVGFPTVSPTIENLERNLIKGTIGLLKPLKGLKAGTVELVVELRAAGVSAGDSDEPEASLLFESALGTKVDNSATFTVDVGSTATVVELTTGGSSWAANDIIFVDGEIRFVVSISTDSLTLNSALTKGAPASGTSVFGGWTYKPASEGHKPFSLAVFQDAAASGPEFRGLGCRISSLALSDLTVGQIPKATFTLELLTHDEVIGTSPASPVFEPQVPPVVINGIAQRDDAAFNIATLELTLENTVPRELDINTAGGTRKLFITRRMVSGTVDPFIDQSAVTLQDAWRDNTTFEFFLALGVKDSSGDVIQGTAVAIYMPTVIFTENAREDQDGVLKHSLSYQAHELETGSGDDDIFIGFI